MRKNLLLKTVFGTLLFVSAIFGQQTDSTYTLYSAETIKGMKALQSAALKSDYAYSRTRYFTNNIGPRLSGSPQSERAIEYVADEMRKLGLEVRLQPIMVPHWVRGEEKASLVKFPGMATGTTQKLSITALGGSTATPEAGLTAEVVVVQDFDELLSLGKKGVEGKIVFFNNKFDRRMAKAGKALEAYSIAGEVRRRGVIEATKLGAVACVIRSVGSSENRLAHTGGIGFEPGLKNVPAAAVSFEDGELISHLAGEGLLEMHLVLTPKTLPDKRSYNVIADLKGTEKPDEVIVVSGHLDSWDLGTGALDDAVGVAMAMQVPKLIKDLGLKNLRTIRVVAFMNEENGFRGARKYAEEADIGKHFAAIESDLGASHPVGFLFAGKQEAMNFLRPISAVLTSQGAGYIERKPNVSSDISLLTARGVPSFAPFYDSREYFNYHHNAADTFDKVNPKDLAENAALMAVIAYGLSNLERPLPR
ncbi:MAG: M20/M25/M40 family metallo-hydrolase [Pyrinomonadaceae bacterium]|nr:M20/M25/M40 family metallo-hydrolase [Pyrinomonadaceae bacterium]